MKDISLSKQLIARAILGIHPEKKLITNFSELLVQIKTASATRCLVKVFKLAYAKMHREYLYKIQKCVDTPQINTECKMLKICIDFYRDDYKLIQHLIREYLVYRLSSRLFMTKRPLEEQFDFITGEVC